MRLARVICYGNVPGRDGVGRRTGEEGQSTEAIIVKSEQLFLPSQKLTLTNTLNQLWLWLSGIFEPGWSDEHAYPVRDIHLSPGGIKPSRFVWLRKRWSQIFFFSH